MIITRDARILEDVAARNAEADALLAEFREYVLTADLAPTVYPDDAEPLIHCGYCDHWADHRGCLCGEIPPTYDTEEN